jgi:hypothetical protein
VCEKTGFSKCCVLGGVVNFQIVCINSEARLWEQVGHQSRGRSEQFSL